MIPRYRLFITLPHSEQVNHISGVFGEVSLIFFSGLTLFVVPSLDKRRKAPVRLPVGEGV